MAMFTNQTWNPGANPSARARPAGPGSSPKMRLARKPQGPSPAKSIAARNRRRGLRMGGAPAAPMGMNPGLAPVTGLPGLSGGLPR
jgi:hypothetical protein